MSAKISALLRATLPRYEAKPAVEEPAVVEVDDEVVELPKLIVTGDRPPIFTEREVQTKTGMAELVRKRYPGASFKGQPDQCPNYARLMYADDERRLRLDDLKTTAAVFKKQWPTGDAFQRFGVSLHEEAQMSRLRYIWPNHLLSRQSGNTPWASPRRSEESVVLSWSTKRSGQVRS